MNILNNTQNFSSQSPASANPRFWCFMCEKEFSQTISEPSEVFCPQCGGISEAIEENNDPKQFKVAISQNESTNLNSNQQSQANISNNASQQRQGQQNPTRGGVAVISSVQEGPFGRIIVRTVVPQFGSTAHNPIQQGSGLPEGILQMNPFGALMNPLFSNLMMGGSVFGDMESRIIEEFLRNDPNRYGPPPASQETLDKLQETMYSEGKCVNKECTVCQEDYKDDDKVLHLPCNHNFHKSCVTEWLLRHDSCPICRKGIQNQEQEQSNQPPNS